MMMNSTAAIEVQGVQAGYGQGARAVTALNGVDLIVEPGTIFGLLGPNGAGKTTLLSCIEGLLQPWAGQIRVLGDPADTPRARARLGVQLQKTALLDDLSVAETVAFTATLYDVHLDRAQTDALLTAFGLKDLRNRPARQLSGGQQQRLALAAALASDPQIVLLDEPTSALDPNARREVWGMIRTLHEQGRTVLITTHAMEEAEALCSRVAIVDQGRIIACGTPNEIVTGLNLYPVLRALIELPLDLVCRLPGVRTARHLGQYLEVETEDAQVTLPALQRLALDQSRVVAEITLRQPTLEDAFIKLTGRTLSA
jgi:ABC-2 type transport system ATP-binding protein